MQRLTGVDIGLSGYENYFNYQLNTKTWRSFVNKQILQTYHRLMIEKQLKDVKRVDKELKEQIAKTEERIRMVRQEIQHTKENG